MKRRGTLHRAALIAVCLPLILVTAAFVVSGNLDPTFSGDGMIIQSFGGTQHAAHVLAVQADGKLVVAGDRLNGSGLDFVIARYNTDGTLDTTFSGDGKQAVNIGVMDQVRGIAIQTDGKIVLAGQACNGDFSLCDVAVARLTATGALDTTFSGDGKVKTNYKAGDNGGLALAMQGTKIVVAGYAKEGTNYNAAIYRYLSNGSLDPTFSGDGIQTVNFGGHEGANSVAVLSGKIHVTGDAWSLNYSTSDFFVLRLNSNGTLDTTFSGDGKVRTNLGGLDHPYDLVLSAGKVIVAGVADTSLAIVQYTSAGALDATFSGDGKLVTNLGLPAPWLNGVALQSGNIVGVGGSGGGDALVVRFTSAGDLDTTFSTDGIVTTDWGGGTDVYRSVLFRNSRLYVCGISKTIADVNRFIVAAYLP